MIPWNLIFSAALLIFLIVIDLYCLDYTFEVRLFPWVIGLPTTIMLILLTIKELYRFMQKSSEEAPDMPKQGNYRAYALITAWMVGFPIMIYALGFFAGIPLFVFLYLKTHGISWLKSLILSAGLIIAIYAMFSLGMEMRLYPGLISSLMPE